MTFHEDAFDAAVEIVASAVEENEVEISTEGGTEVNEVEYTEETGC